MKIAVLISGEYRKFDICRPSMHFLNDPDIDVYISTWDKTHYLRSVINLSKYEEVTVDKIQETLQRPATIEIESTEIQKKLPEKYSSSMIHRWKRGFEMILNSGIDYDYIVITRPDVFFISLIQSLSPENLYQYENSLGAAWQHDHSKLNDIFMISSYKKMKELFKKLSVDAWANDDEKDWHTWWYNFAQELFDDIIPHPGEMTVCRYFSKKGQSLEEIKIHHQDWNELQIMEMYFYNPDYEKTQKSWPPHIVKNAIQRWQLGDFKKYIE